MKSISNDWQVRLCLQLAPSELLWIIKNVSAQEIIEQIKALPPDERAQVAKFVKQEDDSWVPESFKEGMKAAAEGRFVDMERALFESPPPHLR